MAKNEKQSKVTDNALTQEPPKTNKKAIKNIPTMPFEDAFIIAKGIWECASGQKVRRITLFDHLGKSPESGPSRSLITASSKYGLTTLFGIKYLTILTEDGQVFSYYDGQTERIADTFCEYFNQILSSK